MSVEFVGTGSVGTGVDAITHGGMAAQAAVMHKLHNIDTAHEAISATEDGDRLLANVDWVCYPMPVEEAAAIITQCLGIVVAGLNGIPPPGTFLLYFNI